MSWVICVLLFWCHTHRSPVARVAVLVAQVVSDVCVLWQLLRRHPHAVREAGGMGIWWDVFCCYFDGTGHQRCVCCDSYCVDIHMQSGKLVAWVFGGMCFVVIFMARVISGVCVVTATVWTSTCSQGSWWQCATDPTACLTTPVPLRDSRQRPTSRSEPLFSAQHFVFFAFFFFLLVFCLFVLS